jgi:hypothetical protein
MVSNPSYLHQAHALLRRSTFPVAELLIVGHALMGLAHHFRPALVAIHATTASSLGMLGGTILSALGDC